MELTKQAIADIRLTCVQNKYYIAQEVDGLLDDISESVDRLQQEIQEQSRVSDSEREELTRLRNYELCAREEIQKLRDRIEQLNRANASMPKMLYPADRQAQAIVDQARVERETILQDVKRRRERVVAANRCAYYSALQFKQDMQQQFEEFESQMNLAMSALMMVDGAQPCITVGEADEPDRPEDEGGYAGKGSALVDVYRKKP